MQYDTMDLKCDCPECQNHCRDWREMKGGTLPVSDHAPSCSQFKQKRYFRIAPEGDLGPFCIVEKAGDVRAMTDGEEVYDISIIRLTVDQFNRLAEFEGF